VKRLVGAGFRDCIQAGLELMPSPIRERFRGVHFLCGVDPLFVGLHDEEVTTDGRSYRDTAHVCYGRWHMPHMHLADRVTTVALPAPVEPWVIVHELGHVLDEQLEFAFTPKPVTDYAETHRMEAFAEAFTAWCIPWYAPWSDGILYRDEQTVALFRGLEAA
jgi:hypothetical protein